VHTQHHVISNIGNALTNGFEESAINTASSERRDGELRLKIDVSVEQKANAAKNEAAGGGKGPDV
jgi:hypothetical protein